MRYNRSITIDNRFVAAAEGKLRFTNLDVNRRATMKYIREQDVEGDRIGPPHQRVIRHLVTPENMGSQYVWLGTSSVDPGFTSNAHAHEDQEEVFYCVSGKGRIKVDDEEMPLEPGVTVYVPPKGVHQLINDGDEILKVVSAVAPPFIPEKYRKDHALK
jgi:mannose-6-phosphate isomerase-like protein (cupin superfamily)